MTVQGKVFRYGDNVDTDVIIPARYLNSSDPAELARHCLEDLDGTFAARVRPGDILVAGENFGCGSSREHAPLAIKACGISCVIAASFARIFYRNAINIGLPIVECRDAAAAIRAGDTVEVNLTTGEVLDLTTRERFTARGFPPFIQNIVEKGGLLAALKEETPRE